MKLVFYSVFIRLRIKNLVVDILKWFDIWWICNLSKNWKSSTISYILTLNIFSELNPHQFDYIVIVLDLPHLSIFMPKLAPVPIQAKPNLPLMKAFACPWLIQLILRFLLILDVNIPMCELTSLSILASPPLDPVLAHFSLELSSIDNPRSW